MTEPTPDKTDDDLSTTKEEQPEPMGKTTVAVAAFILALPAAIPLMVLVDPTLVPFVSEIDTGDAGLMAFLVGMSAILLIANWGILYVIYRWLQNMARDDAR
ncbi:MAG: hypothetical protein ACLFVJ_04035 [Persicimonas sp.]